MPPTAPRSLSDADAAAVIAFLLRSSDMPAGPAALPTDRGQLARITFGRSTTGSRAPAARQRRCARRRRARPRSRRRRPALSTEWTTYGGNLASHRYSPADQITKDNFNRLQIAWRLKTDFLGPDTRHAVLRDAAGGRPHALHDRGHAARGRRAQRRHRAKCCGCTQRTKGRRGSNAIRNGAGRGLSYWASADGSRPAHHLRHAGLSTAGARRQNRHSDPDVRAQRRRRSEARKRPGDRPRYRRDRAERHAARRRRRDRRSAPRTGPGQRRGR